MSFEPMQALSRPVLVKALPEDGTEVAVEAKPEERVSLARLNGLVDVASLTGRYSFKSEPSGGIRVRGSIAARVTQTCTVSLDPFEADVAEDVDVTFLPEKSLDAWRAKQKGKVDDPQSLDDDDPPDAIVDGRIDLGALTAEFLALGLDPYPRKPGVAFEPDPSGADKDPSPFAALAQLKRES